MSNNILFIFEGTQAEPVIFNKNKSVFFEGRNVEIQYAHSHPEISGEEWYQVIGINYLRALKLVDIDAADLDEVEYQIIPQIQIYDAQYEKHIKRMNEILILSAIPFFVLEYFGAPLFKKIDFRSLNVYCKYFCG